MISIDIKGEMNSKDTKEVAKEVRMSLVEGVKSALRIIAIGITTFLVLYGVANLLPNLADFINAIK